MLSYLLIQKLRGYWSELDMTVEEGSELLETLGTLKVKLDGNITVNHIPKQNQN
jgi:hypothetical protein